MINRGFSRLGIYFLYLVSLLPFTILYLLADFIYVFLYHLTGYRRKTIRKNLRNSFPEKSLAECRAIEKKYYAYLADLMVESIKTISIGEKELRKHFQILNPELLESYFDQGKSILGVLGHYGNWEMAALITGFVTDKKRLIIYKPLNNPVFDAFFKHTRSRFGTTLIPMKSTMRTLAAYRNEPKITVFVSDQTPVRHETQYFTQFLNQPTAVFLGIEKMAKMTNDPIVFCDIKVVKRGHYTCTFVPLVLNPQETATHEITDIHVRYLEEVIRREPQYWLWSHKRWKFKPEDIHS
ncbi:MAG: lysophospholipid acyltransferase family protein [Sphingobacteriaceae bacterium]